MSEIRLAGCVPDRLLTYLAALGVLRTIGRQADRDARGTWVSGGFVLESRLDRDELERFFLQEYQPAPLVMPWNSGAFSAGKEDSAAGKALALLEASPSGRLAPLCAAADQIRALLREAEDGVPRSGVGRQAQGSDARPDDKERKKELLRRCRNELPDDVVEWIDAAVVLTSDGEPEYPPLLGSGGNDGRMDFTSNYMQRLADVMPADVGGLTGTSLTKAIEQSSAWLRAALYGEGDVSLQKASVGQFDAGGAGGPNASAGFSASSVVNPWQFVLALEGSLLLASAATRRLRAGSASLASIPFTVRPLAVAYASAAEAEVSKKARAELWLPVWGRGWTISETEQVFGEGRLSVGRGGTGKQAGDPIDVARAIAQLGIDRGIDAFLRFTFLQRNGDAHYAVYAGQLQTPRVPNATVGLLGDLAAWHGDLRRAHAAAGAAFGVALRSLEEAMYRFAQVSRDERLVGLLAAMGCMEQAAAQHSTSALRKDSAAPVPRPLQGLGPNWVPDPGRAPNTVRIALALASIQRARTIGWTSKIGTLRSHLEPVEESGRGWAWTKGERPTVVWDGGGLVRNMCAVLERRVTEALQHDEAQAPLSARLAVNADDVAAFLAGAVDDDLIADLVWAFGGLSERAWGQIRARWTWSGGDSASLPPNAYTLLKLVLLPQHLLPRGATPARSWQAESGATEPRQTFEPRVVWLLQARRLQEALDLAGRRLRVAGLPPLASDYLFPTEQVARLEAALLLPVSTPAIRLLEERVLAPPGEQRDGATVQERR